MKTTVIEYFESQAKSGIWGSLYDEKNPASYSFLLRVENAVNLLKDVSNKKIVDLGCGTGILLPHVIHNGGEYIGIDISDNMMVELKKHYSDLIEEEKIKLVLGDIRDISIPGPMDVAIGLGFIEYFEKPEEIVKKLHSSMKENGELILSFPNFGSLDYFSLRLLSPFRWITRKLFGKETVQPPRTFWNTANAKALFEDNGFKDVRVVNYHINILAYPFTRFMPRLVNAVGKLFENTFLKKYSWFASSFIVVGRKI